MSKRPDGQNGPKPPNARTARLSRQTKETKVELSLDLDGSGQADIHTGVGFFDHMLELLSATA